jgi:hypothetical protein
MSDRSTCAWCGGPSTGWLCNICRVHGPAIEAILRRIVERPTKAAPSG